jgi:hypothetical protein
MVVVAQLVEHWIVVPAVAGSSPDERTLSAVSSLEINQIVCL